jgi:hypothetical protein
MSELAPSNAVTRLYETAQGRDWVLHQWDEFVAIHAPDVVVEARSGAGQRYEVRGRDAAVSEARSLSDVGLRHLAMEPLAVHGERLALIRWVNWTDETDYGGGPASVEQVVVVEADGDGKVAQVVIFEPDDAALAEAEFARRAAV